MEFKELQYAPQHIILFKDGKYIYEGIDYEVMGYSIMMKKLCEANSIVDIHYEYVYKHLIRVKSNHIGPGQFLKGEKLWEK
jgi:hypothetical protein